MQSVKIIIPVGGSIMVPCDGSLVSFESGSSSTANGYIIVKGDSNSEMRLKVGQLMDTEPSRNWYFKCEDPAATITANIIIGTGQFKDSAVNATIAGTVIVTNNNAAAIPVQKQALATITDFAAVTVGVAPALLISDATQRILRIRNAHATAKVSIGGAAVTAANAVIVLNPNDVWIEEEAAGAVWWAVSDTAATPVNIQGVK